MRPSLQDALRRSGRSCQTWRIGSKFPTARPAADDVVEYETLAGAAPARRLGIERAGSDMLFLYTGGTTGMPKGVMWRHDDLWRGTGAGGNPRIGVPPSPNLANYIERLGSEVPPVNLPLPPMMHGTGLLSAVSAMTHGGTCVTLASRNFDAGRSARRDRTSQSHGRHDRWRRIRPPHRRGVRQAEGQTRHLVFALHQFVGCDVDARDQSGFVAPQF